MTISLNLLNVYTDVKLGMKPGVNMADFRRVEGCDKNVRSRSEVSHSLSVGEEKSLYLRTQTRRTSCSLTRIRLEIFQKDG
jgi:hypothetical protein